MYKVLFSKAALKDAAKLKQSHLQEKCQKILTLLAENPFENVPPYENLSGDLRGYYSRRINVQYRVIYEVDNEEKIVKVLRMWTHYE